MLLLSLLSFYVYKKFPLEFARKSNRATRLLLYWMMLCRCCCQCHSMLPPLFTMREILTYWNHFNDLVNDKANWESGLVSKSTFICLHHFHLLLIYMFWNGIVYQWYVIIIHEMNFNYFSFIIIIIIITEPLALTHPHAICMAAPTRLKPAIFQINHFRWLFVFIVGFQWIMFRVIQWTSFGRRASLFKMKMKMTAVNEPKMQRLHEQFLIEAIHTQMF